ncbi:MAG: feruloyl-CoA synthase [Burkholderiales bacterium]
MAIAPFRQVHFGPIGATVSKTSGGIAYLRSPYPLGAYPRTLTERLAHWARESPGRIYIAGRDHNDRWRELDYAQTLRLVRSIGQALLNRGLSADRPVVILSGNDIEHALLANAAMHVGVLYAPVSPAYSLVSSDFARLRHILGLLKPGLVFAADGVEYGRAIAAAVPPDTELVVSDRAPKGRRATQFGELEGATATGAVERAYERVGPDTVAKILFTSGSTAYPKGVINTQRMLCCNQQMILQTLAFLGDTPPVLLDWSPWHHTAGGNHNFGMAIYNGGSLYIDDGKPIPGGIEKTIRNLREIAPTFYFNVPKGYEEIIPYFRREPALRQKFFSRLSMLLYAGAAMSQHVWDALEQLAVETCGERIPLVTGLGSTETAPFALCGNWDAGGRSGVIGLPAPGLEVKLVPNGEKTEIRVRGPNVTPGYWRDEALTRSAFDEEGYYCMGDAAKWVDADDPLKGLLFDGRIAEDFKLSTGTWVSVGALRAKVILDGAPCIQDVVIAGHDRDDIAVMIFPNLAACRELCRELPAGATVADILGHRSVRARFHELLECMAAGSTGSSNRIARALLLEMPPSIDAHEITDKGSINQRAVLKHRADLVEDLYSEQPSPRVIAVHATGGRRAA